MTKDIELKYCPHNSKGCSEQETFPTGNIYPKKQKLQITITIRKGNSVATTISNSFDNAILGLINEREWNNYWEKEKLKKSIKRK